MEMPEGWHEALNSLDCADAYTREFEFILNLMKEMAEALERHVEHCGNGFKDEELLQKFKEWKF